MSVLAKGSNLGPYRVLEQIGAGGMAKIYRAYQPSMERYVALKVLPSHFAEDPKFVDRFILEARTIARLEHKNILPVYDFGEQAGVTYLVMRYLEGGTLKALLREGRLTLKDTVDILTQVCSALDYAHRQGVIHRDVKPSNIMVDKEGAAFLTDFGIAKVLEGSPDLTESGAAVGTPSYMAPEQALGNKVDGRTDIYSLGVVLYEMIVGQTPFQADTPMAVALAHIYEPLPLPSQISPGIPEPIEAVIIKALAKDPNDRYQTANELLEALKEAAVHSGVALLDSTLLNLITQVNFARVKPAAPRTPQATPPAPTVEPAAPTVVTPTKRSRFPRWAAVLGIVVVIAGLVGGGALLGSSGILGVKENTPIPKATNTAVKETSKESSPSHESEPDNLYDAFDVFPYGRVVDPDLWAADGNCWGQGDGVITTAPTVEGCDLNVRQPERVKGSELGAFEAQFFIGSDYRGGVSNTGLITASAVERYSWVMGCSLFADENRVWGLFEVNTGLENLYRQTLDTTFDEWHTLRLVIDPTTFAVGCFLDGSLIGTHIPDDANTLRNVFFARNLTSQADSVTTATILIDNVVIDPDTIFSVDIPQATAESAAWTNPYAGIAPHDDFTNPAYEDGIDSSKWVTNGDCTFFQEDGKLVVRNISGGNASCDLVMEQPVVEGRRLGAFEAKVQIPSGYPGETVHQYLTLEAPVDEDLIWEARCDLIGNPDGSPQFEFIVKTYGAGGEDFFYISRPWEADTDYPAYDQWYTVQIRIDPSLLAVSCLVNGEVIGSYVPENGWLLRDLPFNRTLVYAWEGGAAAPLYTTDVRQISPSKLLPADLNLAAPIQLRLISNSDWATVELQPEVGKIELGPLTPILGEIKQLSYFGQGVNLTQEIGAAEAGKQVAMVGEFALVGFNLDGSQPAEDAQLVFNVEKGCIGNARLEIYNLVSGPPVLVGSYEILGCPDNFQERLPLRPLLTDRPSASGQPAEVPGACVVPPQGLVAWWPGDNRPENLAGGPPINWVEMESPETGSYQPGLVGGAFAFLGNRGADQVMHTTFEGAWLRELHSFTFETWVRLDSPGGLSSEIERFITLEPEAKVLRHNGNGELHFYIEIDGALQHLRAPEVLRPGVFHHVAGTFDGATMNLYLDGKKINSGTIPQARNTPSSEYGYLSAGGTSRGEPLYGLLDEVSIYSRALNPEEIYAIFLAGSAGKCKP